MRTHNDRNKEKMIENLISSVHIVDVPSVALCSLFWEGISNS